MKNCVFTLSLILLSAIGLAQVGIGTTNPEGALDISSANMGVVVPRVTSIENAVNNIGGDPVNGTVLFDQSRNKICFRVNDSWVCNGVDTNGNATTEVIRPLETENMTYVKASNTASYDWFGERIAISDNGLYFAVSAYREDSNAMGINGDQNNNSAGDSGAVYVFYYNGTNWTQQAYLKASNTESNDQFGYAISISNDGSRIAVGATSEDSNATGVNGNQADNSAASSGAVYVFSRSGTTWSQEAYIKASNTDTYDQFGISVSISGDATRMTVGANGEDSNATGINGIETDNSVTTSGAVYVFFRTGTNWSQEAYIKASNTEVSDQFGRDVSTNSDGSRIAVSAYNEDSNATGINGNQADNSANSSGAVYVFNRSGTTWSQEAYVKASNTDANDSFGISISISNDGSRLLVGAHNEDSSATGLDGNQADNSAIASGAAYLFYRTGTVWSQHTYIKASNAEFSDFFGQYVAIGGDGTSIIISAPTERSHARGINGNQTNNTAPGSGAAYFFREVGASWNQTSYIKASNSDTGDNFGISVAINNDGSTVASASRSESSNATGINGNQDDNSSASSGAAYIIEN